VCVCLLLQSKWVVSAFRQLHRFAKGYMKSGMGHKDQVKLVSLDNKYFMHVHVIKSGNSVTDTSWPVSAT